MKSQDIIYGIRPLQEALKGQPDDLVELRVAKGRQGNTVARIVTEAHERGIPVRPRPAEALTRAVGHEHHQGLVAVMKPYGYTDLEDLLTQARTSAQPPMIIAADCIQDPGNLGAILRSAHALGALGVIIPRDRAVGVTPTVRKASAGALSHIHVAQVTNMARALRQLFDDGGLWPMALVPEAAASISQVDLNVPLTLVIGSEGKGIRPAVLKACEVQLSIPLMGQVASLNASAAAAIACYEVARQRGAGGER